MTGRLRGQRGFRWTEDRCPQCRAGGLVGTACPASALRRGLWAGPGRRAPLLLQTLLCAHIARGSALTESAGQHFPAHHLKRGVCIFPLRGYLQSIFETIPLSGTDFWAGNQKL